MARKAGTKNGETLTAGQRMERKLGVIGENLTQLAAKWASWPEDDKGFVAGAVSDMAEASKAIQKAITRVGKLPPTYVAYAGREYIPLAPGAIVAVSENAAAKFIELGFKATELKKLEVIHAQVHRGGGRLRVKTPSGVEMVLPRIQVTVVSHAE
jgi:hypothetical protein